MTDPRKIVLSAVMYSPNLGDGVIAECFGSVGQPLRWLDLAGRTEFSPPKTGARRHVLKGLDWLPDTVAQRIGACLVKRQIARHLRPNLHDTLRDADGLILGGGQILADAHLNFPLKIAAVSKAASQIPLAIHGVGVSSHWSAPAYRLFDALLGHDKLRHISVRDLASRDHLIAHFRRLERPVPEILVHPDPGFLASDVVPRNAVVRNRPLVGLGITHPVALAAHGGKGFRIATQDFAIRFARLAAAIADAGADVQLFTNGAAEDELCLAAVQRATREHPHITAIPRPETPRGLMELISGFDALVSHRMHAGIVAASYGIPHIGLAWDEKMRAFFALTGRDQCLMDGTMQQPLDIARAVGGLLQGGKIADRMSQIKAAAREGISLAKQAVA